MIVGRGLIAKQFLNVDSEKIIFFASGVSNSSEKDPLQFKREQNLIEETISNHSDKLFVYFSTCSIYDSSKYDSPYVLHKLHMEEIIKYNTKQYLILRVSNVVGFGGNPNLLMNYLFHQISNEKELFIHKKATRNLIDIEDVKDITLKYINSNFINRIVNVAYHSNFEISEIISSFEKILNKSSHKVLENKGEHYSIDIHELDYNFKISSKEKYLENLIKKYYV